MTSLSQNFYSQSGCVGCPVCEGGTQGVKRTLTLWTIAFFTVGMGLIILPFFKKCQFCQHNMFMAKHQGGAHHNVPSAPLQATPEIHVHIPQQPQV